MTTPQHAPCVKCGKPTDLLQVDPIDAYLTDGGDGRVSLCKPCHSVRSFQVAAHIRRLERGGS